MAEGTSVGLLDFTADLFTPLVGQTILFEAAPVSGSCLEKPSPMKLLEVKRGIKSPALQREPFSLLFILKDQPELGMGPHRIIHADFEPADLLVSRVTAPKYEAIDPAGMYYEIVFG